MLALILCLILSDVQHDFILVRVVCSTHSSLCVGMSEPVIGARKRRKEKKRWEQGRRTEKGTEEGRTTYLTLVLSDLIALSNSTSMSASTTGSSNGRLEHRRMDKHDDNDDDLYIAKLWLL